MSHEFGSNTIGAGVPKTEQKQETQYGPIDVFCMICFSPYSEEKTKQIIKRNNESSEENSVLRAGESEIDFYTPRVKHIYNTCGKKNGIVGESVNLYYDCSEIIKIDHSDANNYYIIVNTIANKIADIENKLSCILQKFQYSSMLTLHLGVYCFSNTEDIASSFLSCISQEFYPSFSEEGIKILYAKYFLQNRYPQLSEKFNREYLAYTYVDFFISYEEKSYYQQTSSLNEKVVLFLENTECAMDMWEPDIVINDESTGRWSWEPGVKTACGIIGTCATVAGVGAFVVLAAASAPAVIAGAGAVLVFSSLVSTTTHIVDWQASESEWMHYGDISMHQEAKEKFFTVCKDLVWNMICYGIDKRIEARKNSTLNDKTIEELEMEVKKRQNWLNTHRDYKNWDHIKRGIYFKHFQKCRDYIERLDIIEGCEANSKALSFFDVSFQLMGSLYDYLKKVDAAEANTIIKPGKTNTNKPSGIPTPHGGPNKLATK